MSEQNNGETGAFLAGFILGGLVGAAVAMIMAPSSGTETRKQIVDRGLELRGLTESKLEEARKRAEDVSGDVKVRAEKAAEEARKRAEELQERSRVILEEQKSRITSAVEEARKGAESEDEADVNTEIPLPPSPNGDTPAA
jgi:gas vesicle protein